MTKSLKPQKITFRIWALLQIGTYSCVTCGAATLRIENGRFVMRKPDGEHSLSVDATDDKRLNAHWKLFAA